MIRYGKKEIAMTELTKYHVVGHQQVLLEDSSVFSYQETLLDVPVPTMTPALLCSLYQEHIRRYTRGFVRPVTRSGGVEFLLWPLAISLLSFDGPITVSAGAVSLRIRGGVLVQPDHCSRGELLFKVGIEGGRMQLSLLLSDYCPLLVGTSPSKIRKYLYQKTQALLHRKVTVRFLARVHQELTGQKLPVKVVKVTLREGEDI
jgi:hypothetical protein